MIYLFPNFLHDETDFRKSKNFWETLCQKILIRNNQHDLWEIWFEDEKQGREQFNNFPIFSLINREKSKGVIINQQDPKIHSKWEIAAYTKDSYQYSNIKPVNYLVFNCNLSENAANIFNSLFEKWIQSSCNREDIEKFIESLKGVN